MAIVVPTQNVFINITKGEKQLNSLIVFGITIRGSFKISCHIKGKVLFATKTGSTSKEEYVCKEERHFL